MRETNVRREFLFDGWGVVLHVCFYDRVVDAKQVATMRLVNRRWRAFFQECCNFGLDVGSRGDIGKLSSVLEGGAWDLSKFSTVYVQRLLVSPKFDCRSMRDVRVCTRQAWCQVVDSMNLEATIAKVKKLHRCVVVGISVRRSTRLHRVGRMTGGGALEKFVGSYTWGCREALRGSVVGGVVTIYEKVKTLKDMRVVLSLMRTFSFDAVRHKKTYAMSARMSMEYEPPVQSPEVPDAVAPSDEKEMRWREMLAKRRATRRAAIILHDKSLCELVAAKTFTEADFTEPAVDDSAKAVADLFGRVIRRKGHVRVALTLCRDTFIAKIPLFNPFMKRVAV